MSADGAEQLRILAARAKMLGDRGIVNAARAGIRAEAQPLISAMRASAMDRLPHTGGLNAQVAGQRWTVSVLTGARSAGVRLRTTAPDTEQTDDGYVRHPTFGRRGKGQWRTQRIPDAKGWASDTFTSRAPAVEAGVAVVLNRAIDEAFTL